MKKSIVLPALLLVSVASAFAQKLPKVQTSSIWAPADIKIDGKTTEWNDKFQAHNSGNHIYYTLSNDDNNLYLTARIEDIQGDEKIFEGGITFTIIPSDKKADKIAVTFPVIKWRENRADINDAGGNHLTLYKELRSDTVANKVQIETLIARSNKEINDDYKEIHIKGMPGINGSLLPVYNTEGIRAAAGFDNKMRYTYELAIPLKYLENAISSVNNIKYNIRLNVLPIVERKNPPPSATLVFSQNQPTMSVDAMFNVSDSDFSGMYTLALK